MTQRARHPSGRPARLFCLMGAAGVVLSLILLPGLLGGGEAEADEVVIALKESVEIEAFLKAVGKVTDEPLVWDPGDKQIRGKSIIGALDLRAPKDDLFAVVRALLTFYELVMIPVGPEGYEVWLVMDARRTTSILKLKAKYVRLDEKNISTYENADGLYITTTIRVENMTDLRNARNALTRIVTGQNIGNVTEVADAKAFVITDFAPNVVAIYKLLQEMDVKPEGKEVVSEFMRLEYATADEIEPILSDLFTGRERVSAPGRPRPNNQGSSNVTADPEPRIIPDSRTNQIIVYATRQDIGEIKKIVTQLDVPLYIVNSIVHVIRLKNLEAEDTAEVISALIEASSLFGTSQGVGGTAQPARPGSPASSSDPRQQEKPAVVADIKSNSLLVAASATQYDQIRRIIEEIDVKKSQVLIEVALVELTLDDAYELSVELGGGDDTGLVNDDGSVSGFGFTNYGQSVFADKNNDTYFTDRIPAFVDSAANSAPRGLVGGIFAYGGVPLIFSLLNTVQRTRILQLPSVVTADNEEAVIEVLDRQATTTSTTTSGGVTNGGFGGFQDAGTTLRISPHISDDVYLLLNISLEVSAFVGEERVFPNGTVIPADQISRRLTTVVTVPDRHTVVLGGLLGQTQQSTVERVPGLSDMPLLGDLFQSTAKSDRETSLFLFVTPTIMPGDEEGFKTLDIESCRRKNKADELIGYTEIYNSNFVGCEFEDPSSGFAAPGPCATPPPPPGCVRGSGSASDRLEQIGVTEQTRFHNVSRDRLEAEREARKALLMKR